MGFLKFKKRGPYGMSNKPEWAVDDQLAGNKTQRRRTVSGYSGLTRYFMGPARSDAILTISDDDNAPIVCSKGLLFKLENN